MNISTLLRDLGVTLVLLIAAALVIWCLAQFSGEGFRVAHETATEAQQVAEQ